MRLDARKGDTGWNTYDAERCEVMRNIVWVDDCTNEYGTFGGCVDGELTTVTHRVRKVAIYVDRKLVVINPVEDGENIGIGDLIGILLPTREPEHAS